MYQPESNKPLLRNIRCWRPVYNPRKPHRLDVFSEEELDPHGGVFGLVQKLKDKKVTASVMSGDTPVVILLGSQMKPGDVVIQHPFGNEAHDVYADLGLEQGPMINPT